MLRKRILALAAVAVFSGLSVAAAAAAPGGGNQPFMVFDGLLYKSKPGSSSLGLTPIRQVNSPAEANPSPHNVSDDAVRATLSGLKDYNGVVFLDYELWPLNPASPAELSTNTALLNRVLGLAHATLPNSKFGYYSILPCADYWSIVSGDAAKLRAWQACNAAMEPIAGHVDVILPSLYTYYNDQAGWDKFAAGQLEAARRYHKPVYAFLWPEFHPSNAALKGKNIPTAFWRHQLEFCKSHADGVVIWGGWQEQWDEKAAWWVETKAFLAGLNPR